MTIQNATIHSYTELRGAAATAMCEHCAREQARRQKSTPRNMPPCPWKKERDFGAAKGYGCPHLQESLHHWDELIKIGGIK